MISEKSINAVLVLAAVSVVAMMAKREFAPAQAVGGPPPLPTLTAAAGFDASNQPSTPLTEESGRTTVLVFSDLECPYCRRFHETLRSVEKDYLGKVRFEFAHFPLPSHRFAQQAAEASECAAKQGLFRRFVDETFASQDSIGLLAWQEIGRRAGVADTAALAACIQERSTINRVADQRESGRALGITSTPTIIVSGHRFSVPPTERQLRAVLDAAIAGKPVTEALKR
jgi:protein-disulfide isomerase